MHLIHEFRLVSQVLQKLRQNFLKCLKTSVKNSTENLLQKNPSKLLKNNIGFTFQ